MVASAIVGYHFLFPSKAAVPTTPTINLCGVRKPSDAEQYTGPPLVPATTAIQAVVTPATSINMKQIHILPSQNQVYILSESGQIRTISIYNLTTKALVTSFTAHITGNSDDYFALDPQGNIYVLDNVSTQALYKQSPTGTVLWQRATAPGSPSAYGYVNASGNFQVAVGNLVWDQNGNPQPNNAMVVSGEAEQDATTGDIMAIVGGMFRVYTNAGTLKFQMGTDLGPGEYGPFHFNSALGAVEKPGGAGYYIADTGHGMESFDASGGLLGIAPDFQIVNGAANTIGVNPGSAVFYNGSLYYLLGPGGINSFDGNNNKAGLYSISQANLDNDINYPQTITSMGIGSGMFTNASYNYFPSGTSPQVYLQFYQWWQAQASAFVGTYTIRSIEQVKSGAAGNTFSFSIPTDNASYAGGVANVPITLPPAQPGLYEINMHLLRNGQPVGATCLNYTVGAPGSGFNASKFTGGVDTKAVEMAHQFGQKLVRSGYSMLTCYPGVTTPTMATAPACPVAMASDVAAAAALAEQYGMNYEIQLGDANTAGYLSAGTPVFQHMVQQMVTALPAVKNWECWNEPDNNTFSTPTDYMIRALSPCFQAVKNTDPNDKVIGGSFSSMSPFSGAWQQFVQLGIPYVDIIALHTYTGHNRSFEEQGYVVPPIYATGGELGTLRQFQIIFANAGFHGQIWDTEQGFWKSGAYNSYTQGDRLIRKQILERSEGIDNAANFTNSQDYSISGQLFTLIDGGSLTSGGAASVIYGDKLYGRPFVTWLTTGVPHTYAAVFGPSATDTGQMVAVWSDDFSVNVVPALSSGGTIATTDEFGQASDIASGSNLGISGSVSYLAIPSGKSLTITAAETFGPNLVASATGATATASSSYNCGSYALTPGRALDGILDTQNLGNLCDDTGMSLWVGAVGDNAPTYTITLAQPKAINRVYVSSQGLGSVEVGLRDYTVSFDTGNGSFGNPITVTNQYMARDNLIQLPSTLTVSRIKISGMTVNYSGYGDGLPPPFWNSSAPGEPTIYEVEAYAPGGNQPPPNQGDFNGDGHVTIADLSILAAHFGGSGTAAQGDANGDGVVNITDLSILAAHWGT